MEYLGLLVMGILLSTLGIVNIRGRPIPRLGSMM